MLVKERVLYSIAPPALLDGTHPPSRPRSHDPPESRQTSSPAVSVQLCSGVFSGAPGCVPAHLRQAAAGGQGGGRS